jgi:hypothetical protein
MLANRKILRVIIDDPASTDVERTEAKRALAELTTAQSTPPSPRRGRNANTPQSQEDIDNDIESSFRYDSQLTAQDRIEIERGFDAPTQAILAAFGSSVLWLFGNNLAEIQLLIDLHGRTRSDIVRKKAVETIKWIADYSPTEAKIKAQQFLDQLQKDNT